MAWRIELSSLAQKHLDQMDPQVVKRLLKFLYSRVAPMDDPRAIGEALKGSKLGEFRKYRIGDYRIVCNIDEGLLLVTALAAGNRRNVYKVQSNIRAALERVRGIANAPEFKGMSTDDYMKFMRGE